MRVTESRYSLHCWRRRIRRLGVALFALALVAPTLDLFVRPSAARSVQRENRRPAPAPAPITDLASLSHFPGAFERWFADRMGGRDLLQRGWQRLRWLELGVDPLPTIVRGADGFDFYAWGQAVEANRGARPFSEKELELVTRALEAQRERCARLGAEFVYVIIPNKETIYADKWPERLVRIGPTRLEQLFAWLRTHSDVRCVDLRQALVREREHDRPAVDDLVYYPRGSHLTWRGGLAAWNAIASELSSVFPDVHPLSRTDYTLEESPIANEDSLWEQTYVSDHFHQRGWWLIARAGAEAVLEHGPIDTMTESKRDDPRLPTCLFVHDSFGPWMTPFAARSFSHLWALRGLRVPRDHIERSRPRVVIHETTERTLSWDLGDFGYDIEHVSEAEFRGYAPYFGPVDFERDALLATSGGVSLQASSAGWRIEQRVGDGLIGFPAATPEDGARLAVHIEIEAPFEGNMALYFLTKTESHYARARVLALVLHEGVNDLYMRLLVPDLTGSVRMRLSGPGDYAVRAFEMRMSH